MKGSSPRVVYISRCEHEGEDLSPWSEARKFLIKPLEWRTESPRQVAAALV